jgi:oligoribonuclease NrnB/cAMP/cGMP phosphodiesterase (DHH superfamily)
MDGHCAGAIVYNAYHGEGEYFPINYKDQFPFEKIEKDETVVIVDFSLQGEGDFNKLLTITRDIIWIDHHKTAIEKHADLDTVLKGLRRDGVSGCELAWEFFFPTKTMPRVVQLLGDYDIWAFKYGDDTNKLQAGIRLFNTYPDAFEWDAWLKPGYQPTEEIKSGEIALKYRDNYYSGLIKAWSFFTEFEGHKAIACNAGSVSSQMFDTVKEDYDIMMPFVFDGKRWTVSLYTKKKDIDVSELAKRYGGGGHRQAAGFQCDTLPFVFKG